MSDNKYKFDSVNWCDLEKVMNDRAAAGWLLVHICNYTVQEHPWYQLVWLRGPSEGFTIPLWYMVI